MTFGKSKLKMYIKVFVLITKYTSYRYVHQAIVYQLITLILYSLAHNYRSLIY